MKIVGGWFCVPDIPCYFGGFDVRTGNKIGGGGGLSGSQRGSLPVSQITSLPPPSSSINDASWELSSHKFSE